MGKLSLCYEHVMNKKYQHSCAWYNIWDFTYEYPRHCLIGFVHLVVDPYKTSNALYIARHNFPDIIKIGVAGTTGRKVKQMNYRLREPFPIFTDENMDGVDTSVFRSKK
jgi:hypothetical protein